MSLTNDPPFFLISDDPVTSCSDQGKTPFFGPLANLLHPRISQSLVIKNV